MVPSEIDTEGGILMYIPFRGNELGAADYPLSHSKERNLLLEGVRYNARQILERWAVLEVLPIASTIC